MIKFVKFVVLLVTFSTINNCARIKNKNVPVQIRILNNTEYDFTNLKIRDSILGELKSGDYSEYVRFSYGYSYDHVYFKIKEDEFEQIPADFVGERKLKSGSYSYAISIDSYEERLFLIELIKD